MKTITSKSNSDVSDVFKWRDQHGNLHKITKMDTRHLFHTVRMVWNHKMPAEAVPWRYHSYMFSDHYSDQYLTSAIRQMIPELMKRSDMEEIHKQQLNFMITYLSTNQLEHSTLQLEDK